MAGQIGSSGRSLIYVTAESADQAQEIGETLVAERLAACANILPGMQSIYWWRGKMEEASEALLLLKTRDELVDALVARVRELHSYSCPCVVVLPISGGNPAYLEWITEETTGV